MLKNVDYLKQTPLHIASQKNATDVARVLIAKGANVNAKDNIHQITFHQTFMMFVLIHFEE